MEPAVQKKLDLSGLREALSQGLMLRVEQMLVDLKPAETALLLESLPPAKREVVWKLLPPEDEGDVLAELNDEVRALLMSSMDAQDLVAATEGMEIDDLADVVADLPESLTQQLIRSLNQRDRERLEAVLSYAEDSAGGLMNPDTIAVRRNVTLEVVLRYLRFLGELPNNTNTLFVVDRNDHYRGTLSIARLITHDQQARVSEVMDSSVEGILAETSAADVAQLFQTDDLVAAPVLDDAGKLLGQITVDDVVDVIREQAEHEILGKAGLDEEDDIFAPVVTSVGRRSLWLGINLATAFLAAAVVGIFEETLSQIVVLAVLMPVVASMGGIAGTQTLTLMVRSMALGKVGGNNARWLLSKEFLVGVVNGFMWSVIVALITVIFFGGWDIGLLIGAAVAINLVVAALAGSLIPLLLPRLGIDPAIAGGVVLTTVTDVVGFMTFLGLGTLFLL